MRRIIGSVEKANERADGKRIRKERLAILPHIGNEHRQRILTPTAPTRFEALLASLLHEVAGNSPEFFNRLDVLPVVFVVPRFKRVCRSA